jgi:hypothetical protein
MAIIPEQFQQKLDYVLQQNMSYETLSATNRGNVTRKMIEVLQELSQPSRFDNYIDVMQKYIDLAHKIVSEGATEPPPRFAGQGWTAEIDMLHKHFKAFTEKIMKLASNWMGSDYKQKYYVDFLGPLKELDVKTRIGYFMEGYDTPDWLIPFFEDLKTRLIRMTENDTISSNEVEKATNVWKVCKILQDRAMFIADSLIHMMERIAINEKVVVSINLKEIIARVETSQGARGGRKLTRHRKSNPKSKSNHYNKHKRRSYKKSSHRRRRH